MGKTKEKVICLAGTVPFYKALQEIIPWTRLQPAKKQLLKICKKKISKVEKNKSKFWQTQEFTIRKSNIMRAQNKIDMILGSSHHYTLHVI